MQYDSPLPSYRESLQAFAGVILGHNIITEFDIGAGFQFHGLDILCSALLTIPALETVVQMKDNSLKAWSSCYNHMLCE
jgi:hypothetical protein